MVKRSGPPPKSVQMAFRADVGLHADIEAAAAADSRTMSQWITVTLRKVLDAQKGKEVQDG